MQRLRTAALLAGAIFLYITALSACDDGDPAPSATPTAAAVAPTSTPLPSTGATLRGTLTLDGGALDAEFLGARVVRDGLVAACQNELPDVTDGAYEIEVASDVEVRGCGGPGAQVLLWTYVNDAYYFSTSTIAWPGEGARATFDAAFSSSTPQGAAMPVTEFKGHLWDRENFPLPPETVVEAYAGETLCGLTSLRAGDEVEGYYTLMVAGPLSIAECGEGATLTFRLDGAPVVETAVNDLQGGGAGHELDLTVE
jgi:hypothetical protein